MEGSNSENIPSTKAAIQPTEPIVQNNDEDQEQPSVSRPTINQTTVERVQSRNTYFLELPVLLLFYSWNLSGTVFQNQVIYQSCILNYNESTCKLLANEEIPDALVTIEVELEEYASKIFMARAILESIIPAFISFLIGPWSDKFGRKPILLSTFFGYFLAYALLCSISVASSYCLISPWFYLFAFIPLSLLGGTCALITGIFCYISDVSFERDRGFRMARMEAAVFVGLLLGSLSSGRLYKLTSASVVFGCAALCTLLGLICVYFFVKESIKNQTEETGRMAKFKALFEWKHVVDLFYTCFKRRENNDRGLIWLIILALASSMFVLEGSVALSYLFMREKFKWMITDYNLYSAFNVICQVFGNIFGTYVLNKMFGIPEILMAIFGYFSAMLEYIVTGLATYSWQLYVASIVVMLKGVAVPMCRAYLACLVPSCEIGKIYSMTTSMESLAPIGAAPIYTFIYNYTIDTYPGAFNFFSALVYLYCIILITTVFVIRRRQEATSYERIINMVVKIIENNPNLRDSIQPRDFTEANIDEDEEEVQESTETQSTINLATVEAVQSINTYPLELSFLLFFFSANLNGTVFQNEIVYQSCKLDHSESTCKLLTNEMIPNELVDLELEVEKYASKIFMCQNILINIIPAIISFFIVPWSDKYGRKPLLMSSFAGFSLSYGLLCVISIAASHFKLNPWFYLLGFIPYSLFGGVVVFITGVYSYSTDTSSVQDRGLRLARLEAAALFGLIIGSLTCKPIYQYASASIAFGFCAGSSFLGLMCVYFFINESIKNETEERGFMAKLRALFEWKHVVDLLDTCFKRREHNGRILIWLVIFTLILRNFAMNGAESVNFLFMRDRFKWMITDYAIYSSFNMVCQVFGNLIGSYVLNKMFGLPEILVILISFYCLMADYVMIGLADHSSQLYIIAMMMALKVVALPMSRAYLASLVPSSEIGKVFSASTSFSALVLTFAAPVYTFIYNLTIDTYPGAFNSFSAVILLMCILLMTIAFLIRSKRQEAANYEIITS
ncbi:uncharacterized protein LOC116337604 [Contarinia nasturtii]|uniref:uncharacterized protein LOC116337604 n=1 Tax=Contarinia nasturtii TaxID=265458 RepID=UPI0012D37DA0|nr:uncharacterized protein LOC116337604 [Contarinia nasturtii]